MNAQVRQHTGNMSHLHGKKEKMFGLAWVIHRCFPQIYSEIASPLFFPIAGEHCVLQLAHTTLLLSQHTIIIHIWWRAKQIIVVCVIKCRVSGGNVEQVYPFLSHFFHHINLLPSSSLATASGATEPGTHVHASPSTQQPPENCPLT